DRKNAGAQLPAPDRRDARSRRPRPAHSEGLHLLGDGLLPVRRDAQSADHQTSPKARRAEKSKAGRRPTPDGPCVSAYGSREGLLEKIPSADGRRFAQMIIESA